MIDIIINEKSGLVIVHDERRLDDYDQMRLNLKNGECVLDGPKGKLPIGNLESAMIEMITPDILQMFKEKEGGYLIRMNKNDNSFAKVGTILIQTQS